MKVTGKIRIAFIISILAGVQSAHALRTANGQANSIESERLLNHLGPPSAAAIRAFHAAGVKTVEMHVLSESERKVVVAALETLPASYREVLKRRLNHISFVESVPGEGTALTSRSATKGRYDITIRSSVINQSLSTFLTNKELRAFHNDESGLEVRVLAAGTDALTYLLLHETTHILDFSRRLTAASDSTYTRDIWTSERTLVPALAASPLDGTYFRSGHPIAIAHAASLYASLEQSPFVSLYGTSSEHEDLAELAAWRYLERCKRGSLSVEVWDHQGNIVQHWEPFTFPRVQARFRTVDALLGRQCG